MQDEQVRDMVLHQRKLNVVKILPFRSDKVGTCRITSPVAAEPSLMHAG